jgi:hypothetical protein
MIKPPTPKLMLVLCGGPAGGQVAVEFGAFLEFSRTMERDLSRLESKWSTWAAPRAKRTHGVRSGQWQR